MSKEKRNDYLKNLAMSITLTLSLGTAVLYPSYVEASVLAPEAVAEEGAQQDERQATFARAEEIKRVDRERKAKWAAVERERAAAKAAAEAGDVAEETAEGTEEAVETEKQDETVDASEVAVEEASESAEEQKPLTEIEKIRQRMNAEKEAEVADANTDVSVTEQVEAEVDNVEAAETGSEATTNETDATVTAEGEEQKVLATEAKPRRLLAFPREQQKKLDAALEAMLGDNGTKVVGLGVVVFQDGREMYSRFMGDSYIGRTVVTEKATGEISSITMNDTEAIIAEKAKAAKNKQNQSDSVVGDVQAAEVEDTALVEEDGISSIDGMDTYQTDKYPNRLFTRASRFRSADLSKQFVVFSIMQLVEKGKLNLDEDASKYLGFSLRNPAHPETPITLRMLASQTSSIRDGLNDEKFSDSSIEEYFKATGKHWDNGVHFAKASEAPGQYFKESHLNYGLLATIIEKVTHQRFDKYQKNNILKQLDIVGDYIPSNFSEMQFEDLGTIYVKMTPDGQWDDSGAWRGLDDNFNYYKSKENEYELPEGDTIYQGASSDGNMEAVYSLKNYKVGTNASIFAPDNGLRLSTREIGNVLKMIFNRGTYNEKQILKPESLEAMFAKQWEYNPGTRNGDTENGTVLSYGLGEYQIDGTSTARVVQGKEVNLVGLKGKDLGIFTGMFFRPGTRDGFVYVMNGEAISPEQGKGTFSGNSVWEENIMNAIGDVLFAETEDSTEAVSK